MGNHWYIPVAVAAGALGDLVAGLSRPSPQRRVWIRLVAFVVPAVWYAIYLIALGVWGEGIGWSIHMVLGAPLLAGATGLLLSFVAFPGTVRLEPTAPLADNP